MAQSYVLSSGSRVIVPGTYVSTSVINNVAGVGVAGVLTLVGESSQGPHWSEESDLTLNGFGPDQLSDVVKKYGSGQLVDGFRAAITGNGDSRLQGSVTTVYLVKTNQGSYATGNVVRSGFSNPYATISAILEGKPGNNISFQDQTAQAEVAPEIQNIGLYLHPTLTSAPAWRVDGGAADDMSIPAIGASLPTSLTQYIDVDPAQLLTTGGDERVAIPSGSGTLATTVVSGNLVITLSSGAWATTPVAGDIAVIHSASSIVGSGSANEGSYRVAVATATQITLTPVNAGSLDGTVTGAAQGSGSTKAFGIFKPMQVQMASGMDRQIIAATSDKLSLSNITASSIQIQYLDSSSNPKLFAATPQVGENVYIPSALGALSAGWYSVASISNIGQGNMVLNRLSNGALSGSPAQVTVASLSAVQAFKADIDGIGKAVEWVADANASYIFKNNLTATASAGTMPQLNTLIVSSAERTVLTKVIKPASPAPVSESFNAGGDVVLAIGYAGATCSMTISDTMLTTTASVAGDDLSILLADHTTVSDLVAFINTKQNYTASVVDISQQNLSPVNLDNVTTGIAASNAGLQPGRIKQDAFEWQSAVASSIQVNVPVFAVAGLPDNEVTYSYLTGGALGSTSGADFTAAIDACEIITTNFILPLIDQDASLDIAAGTTDPASTYTLDSVNAYIKSHVIAMSATLARKNRIGFCSVRRSFALAEQASQALSHPRVIMSFQQPKDIGSDGNIALQPVWYLACKTAGQSAVAGFQGIVKKLINITGLVQPSGFDSRKRTDLENALLAGLLPVETVVTGGFRNVSDQTTYTTDNNFVYNSLQAMYISDLMTLQLIQDADNTLIGQSIALVSQSVAQSFFETELNNFRRLNYITRSDGAPLGYKNLNIKLVGGVLTVSVSLFIASLLYFIDLSLALTEVTQTS